MNTDKDYSFFYPVKVSIWKQIPLFGDSGEQEVEIMDVQTGHIVCDGKLLCRHTEAFIMDECGAQKAKRTSRRLEGVDIHRACLNAYLKQMEARRNIVQPQVIYKVAQ